MGRTETPEQGSKAAHMPLPIFIQVGQRITRDPFGTDRTVVSAGRASVSHGSDIGSDTGTGTGSVHPTPTQIAVYRAKWVALKGEIGRSSGQ